MHIDYTEEQKALRAELRAYFTNLITPDLRPQLKGLETGPLHKKIIQQMGKDGWLGVGWPVEYGGQGLGAIEQLIWFDEARRAGAPIPFVTLNTVGPCLMARGTEAQKQQFLRAILAGGVHFPIGYSGHETGLTTSVVATALGACLVERHITLDRAMWGSDQSASVEPQGVARLVRDIRVVESALGDGVKKVYDSELGVMQKLRRSPSN